MEGCEIDEHHWEYKEETEVQAVKKNPTFGGDRGSCHLSMKMILDVQVNSDAYQDFEAKSSQ